MREGEADLLLLHPELGMLVLEVKGGRVAFDGRAGTWTSTGRDGTLHEIKDPFAQARRSVKALAAKAAALTVEGQAMPEFVHGHGVVFPDFDYEPGVEPVSAPRELVIDARDLAGDVTGRVEALFRAWGAGRPAAPLTKKWVKRLGQQVLAPHFSHARARLGARVGGEGRRRRSSARSGTRSWWTRRRKGGGTNCRSTTAIAEFLGTLTGAPEGARPRVSPWAVRGEEPRVVSWKDAADERAKAGELVARLLLKEGVSLERVAIVGMRRLEKSCLAGKTELAGFPVAAIEDDGGTAVPGAIRIQRRHRYGPRGRRRPPPRRGRERVGDEAP